MPDTTANPQKPSTMRYSRVEKILESDKAISRFLGEKTVEIASKAKEPRLFSPQVVKVVDTLHSDGKDAQNVSKTDILRMAGHMIINGNGTPAAPAKAAPAPAPAPKAKPAPKSKAPTKPAAPKAAPTPLPEKAPKPARKREVPQVEANSAFALLNLTYSLMQLEEHQPDSPERTKRLASLNTLAKGYKRLTQDAFEIVVGPSGSETKTKKS